MKDEKLELILLLADCLTADRGSSATGLPFSKVFKRKEVNRFKACEELLIRFHSGQLIHVLNSAKESKGHSEHPESYFRSCRLFGGENRGLRLSSTTASSCRKVRSAERGFAVVRKTRIC
jgi:hypothetical protein